METLRSRLAVLRLVLDVYGARVAAEVLAVDQVALGPSEQRQPEVADRHLSFWSSSGDFTQTLAHRLATPAAAGLQLRLRADVERVALIDLNAFDGTAVTPEMREEAEKRVAETARFL